MGDFVWMGIFGNIPDLGNTIPVGNSGGSCGGDPSSQTTVDFSPTVNSNARDERGFSLIAQKFNLAVNFFYSGLSNGTVTEYGRGRNASVRCRITSSTSSSAVTMTLGDMRNYGYTKVGTAGGVTTYTPVAGNGATSSLSFDGTTFTQYLNNGMQLQYAAQVAGGNPVAHQLTKVADADGVAQTYTYGSGVEAGLLKTIQTPGGNTVSFIYMASTGTSLVNAIQDWTGRFWTMQYDASRNMTTYQTPMGCITKFGYDGSNNMTSVQDPQGYTTSFTYSTIPAPTKLTNVNAGSGVWTFTYSGGFSQVKVTNPQFGTMVYGLSGGIVTVMTDVSGSVTSYSY
ncbi:MAG: hypothetical protein NT023_10470, partial [Armatimonadetes bacterium]|nr:hypothetical protein [Armatimonadota bacterium]